MSRLRQFLRSAGRQVEEARRAYRDARASAREALPSDDAGRAKIVCRRHAEKRSVAIDEEGRPDCYDRAHPDCRGCAADVRDGRVETW